MSARNRSKFCLFRANWSKINDFERKWLFWRWILTFLDPLRLCEIYKLWMYRMKNDPADFSQWRCQITVFPSVYIFLRYSISRYFTRELLYCNFSYSKMVISDIITRFTIRWFIFYFYRSKRRWPDTFDMADLKGKVQGSAWKLIQKSTKRYFPHFDAW